MTECYYWQELRCLPASYTSWIELWETFRGRRDSCHHLVSLPSGACSWHKTPAGGCGARDG